MFDAIQFVTLTPPFDDAAAFTACNPSDFIVRGRRMP
jgi:hypothetical protein